MKKSLFVKIAVFVVVNAFLLAQVTWACDGANCTPFNVSPEQGTTGTINQNGTETDINQTSTTGVYNGNLSTNLGDLVKVTAGSASDYTLFRSNTGAPTQADGTYTANDNLIMINSYGFNFGVGSSVNAANLTVSSLSLTDTDFAAGVATGHFHFSGQGSYIINHGHLIAQPGGYVALLSNAIKNTGTIQAQLGHIVLASGEDLTLSLDDNNTIFVVIDQATENAIFGPNGKQMKSAIKNTGTISADGGSVTLTAKTLNQVFDHTINNTGVIQANSLSSTQTGDVVLKTNGDVVNSGTIQGTNVTIKAKGGITSTGSLIDTNFMKLLSQGAIYSLGKLESSSLLERGLTFKVQGVFSPGVGNISNVDGAMEFTGDTSVSGTVTDQSTNGGDIIVDPNVTLTLSGDTDFEAANSFLMDPSSVIEGAGFNLDITAANDVALGYIYNANNVNVTATNGNLTVASQMSNTGTVNLTAGQDIIQQDWIETNNNDFTAHAGQAYYIDSEWTPGSGGPSIDAGTAKARIFAPIVGLIGPGWGFTSNTATNYQWAYLGGLRGGALPEFGYYFKIGPTIIYVPSVYGGPSGNTTSPVSGSQTFLNIDVNNDSNGGQYIVAVPSAGVFNYWYTDPTLNSDGYNHVDYSSAANETNQLISTDGTSQDGASNVAAWAPSITALASSNPNAVISNWEDFNIPGGDADFNDVIVQSIATTMNALIVKANNQSITYGSNTFNPNAVTYTGFVGGDTVANLTTPATAAATVNPSTGNVGTYSINASGAVDPNYSIFYVPGSLTITPATITITADDKSMTYGATVPPLTYQVSGLVNGDTLSTTPTVSTTGTSTSNVGNYDITASGAAASPNYIINYVDGSLTITPASVTISADNQTMTYGGTLPPLTYQVAGLVNGDTLTTAPTVTTTGSSSSNVGNYSITASGAAASSNYTITYTAGNLSITPASLTATADNQTSVYGSAVPPLTVSYSGFVNGDSATTLSTAGNSPATAATTGTSSSNVGNYAITASGAVDPNYTITYVAGNLAITPAPLTITADNQSSTVGTIPTLTATYTGLVNGDTASTFNNPPNTPPVVSTSATTSSAAGPYAITVGGAFNPNYNITYVNGTLTLNPVNIPQPPVTPGFNNFAVFSTNLKVNKIIYETLSPYKLSVNTVQQPLIYFYHPLTPVDQSAFDGISLDQGAYDFIDNNLQVNNLPGYFGNK